MRTAGAKWLADKTASRRQRKLVRYADILAAVLEGRDAGRSPEDGCGRERRPGSVSHETIHAYIYFPDGQSADCRYLPERRKRRKPTAHASVIVAPTIISLPASTGRPWLAAEGGR